MSPYRDLYLPQVLVRSVKNYSLSICCVYTIVLSVEKLTLSFLGFAKSRTGILSALISKYRSLLSKNIIQGKVSQYLNVNEGNLLYTKKSICLPFTSNSYEFVAFVSILNVVFYPLFCCPY